MDLKTADPSDASEDWSAPENWYQNGFDEWYLKLYRHRDRSEAERFVVLLQRGGLIPTGGWCLDLGCGTGRYAECLALRGFNVLALDLSLKLLKLGQHSSNNPRSQLHRVCGDIRRLPVKKSFDLVISLFTSFGYFPDDSTHLMILKDIADILKPKSLFILDLPNRLPVIRSLASRAFSEQNIDNFTVREVRRLSGDGLRVEKRITVNKEGVNKPVRVCFESVRLFRLEELERLFRQVGMRFVNTPWGDYDGSSLDERSPRMILFGGLDV